jgi:anaerobic selenocysteine-containing dehydrogenase
MEEVDIVLPAPTWMEEGGTYTNLMGREQTRQAHLQAPEGILLSMDMLAILEEVPV